MRNQVRSVRNRARSVRKNGTVVQKNGFVVGNADKTPRLAAQIAHQLKTFAQNLTAPTPTANRRRFLLAFLLYQIALYGASAYLPLYLAALHASPAWLTATFAAGVVCEVLIMTQIGRWTDTHGRRPAMLLSFALLPLRLLLYIPATMPLHVLLVQTIHGFNFGILGTIAVVFVNDTASDDNRGAAQAELAATIGLAGSVAPIACGYLVQNVGIHAMFAVMSAVAAVSVALFCAFVAESHPGASGDWTNKLPRYLREPWFGRERERVAIK